jgi:translation initiation factor IF-1
VPEGRGEEIGVVEELLPTGLLKVKLDEDVITAHVAEELRRVTVPLRAGDRVTVRRASKDPTRGSIVGVQRP